MVKRVVFITPSPLFVCVLLPLAMRQAPNTNPHRPTTPNLGSRRPLTFYSTLLYEYEYEYEYKFYNNDRRRHLKHEEEKRQERATHDEEAGVSVPSKKHVRLCLHLLQLQRHLHLTMLCATHQRMLCK